MNPSDAVQFIGTTAEYQCRYSFDDDLQVHLTWAVNDTPLNRADFLCHTTVTTYAEMNNLILSTLAITALNECNETEVNCIVAWYNDSIGTTMKETSNSAVLYVEGELSHQIIRFLLTVELHINIIDTIQLYKGQATYSPKDNYPKSPRRGHLSIIHTDNCPL